MTYLEGNLHVLPAPYIQAWVVGSQLIEVFPVYGEKASSHDWTPAATRQRKSTCGTRRKTEHKSLETGPDGVRDGHVVLLNVFVRYGAPAEHQRPLEDSPLEVINEHVAEERGAERERTL